MSKHTKADAQKSLGLIRKTAKIRKTRPDWVAGFATARIETDKFSAIVAMKRAKARSDIPKFGLTKDKAEGLKDQTDGHLWFEKGTVFLAVQKGSFANARKAMQGYLKAFGLGAPPIKEADPIAESQIALLEDEDEDALAALAEGPDDEDEDGQPDTGSADETPTLEAAEDPQPQAQPEARAAPETTLSQPEQEQARATADQVSGTVRVVLARVLGDLPGMDTLGADLQARLLQRMSEMPPETRAALLETAPSRLLMEATRAAVLGWTGRKDAPDALQTYPADEAVNGAEVADHYVDLGTRVMARAGREQGVSRRLVEQRVTGFFDDTADPEAKFAAIERLTKALLPALKDPERLSKMFGVTPVRGLDDLPPASLGLGQVRTALMTVLNQIDGCSAAHAAALEAEGSSMSHEDIEGFDAIADDLISRSTGFIAAVDAVIAKGTLTAADAEALTAKAQQHYAEVASLFQRMDSCPPALSPTSVAQTYGQALARFAADVRQAVSAAEAA